MTQQHTHDPARVDRVAIALLAHARAASQTPEQAEAAWHAADDTYRESVCGFARAALDAMDEVEIATVEEIETRPIDWPFSDEQTPPYWRVSVGEYCTDFEYEQAARNFAGAINAATRTPPPIIPAGMVAWHGGDSAPEDWDREGRIFTRSGATVTRPKPAYTEWRHGICDDIIAYTPLAAAPKQAEQQGVDAATIRLCAEMVRDRAVTISASSLNGTPASDASKIAARHLIRASEDMYAALNAPTAVESLSAMGAMQKDAESYAERTTLSQGLDAATVERCKAAISKLRQSWFCAGDDCSQFDHGRDEGLQLAQDALAALATDPHQHGAGNGGDA